MGLKAVVLAALVPWLAYRYSEFKRVGRAMPFFNPPFKAVGLLVGVAGVFKLMYAVGLSKYWSPLHWALGVRLSQAPSPAPRGLLWLVMATLQVYEWYIQFRVTAPPPLVPPPPVSAEDLLPLNKCQVCRSMPQGPAVTAQGRVGCYSCLKSTGVPCYKLILSSP